MQNKIILFESMGSSENYKFKFLKNKGELEMDLNFGQIEQTLYNSPYSMTNFEEPLPDIRNSASEIENIPYKLIQLPVSHKISNFKTMQSNLARKCIF